jgi:hypothetical protein
MNRTIAIGTPRDWAVVAVVGTAALSLAFVSGALTLGYLLKKRIFG